MPPAPGQDAAFNGIAKQYYEKIYKFCWYALRGNAIAEDCTQDIFLILYENMNKLRDYDKIGGWLYKTASNISKQYAASLRKERASSVDVSAFFDEGDAWETIPAPLVYLEQGVKDEAAQRNEEKAIDNTAVEIIKQLKSNDKQILRLAFREKRPLKEVSALLGISLSAAKSRVSRLRQRVTGLARGLLENYLP